MAISARDDTTRLDDVLAEQPGAVVEAACAAAHPSEVTGADVVEVAELLGIDFASAPFSVEDLQLGMALEMELGFECAPSMADLQDDDLVEVGMAAASHLQDQPDYYTRLTQPHAPGDPPFAPNRPHQTAEVGAD